MLFSFLSVTICEISFQLVSSLLDISCSLRHIPGHFISQIWIFWALHLFYRFVGRQGLHTALDVSGFSSSSVWLPSPALVVMLSFFKCFLISGLSSIEINPMSSKAAHASFGDWVPLHRRYYRKLHVFLPQGNFYAPSYVLG